MNVIKKSSTHFCLMGTHFYCKLGLANWSWQNAKSVCLIHKVKQPRLYCGANSTIRGDSTDGKAAALYAEDPCSNSVVGMKNMRYAEACLM